MQKRNSTALDEEVEMACLERLSAPLALSHRVDDLLAEEEGDERHDDDEALPHHLAVQLLPLLVVRAPAGVRVVPDYSGEEGVGQEVQQGVPGQRPHRQRDQELDEVLVEGFLQLGKHLSNSSLLVLGGAATCSEGLVMFAKSSPCLLGQHGSCSTAQ